MIVRRLTCAVATAFLLSGLLSCGAPVGREETDEETVRFDRIERPLPPDLAPPPLRLGPGDIVLAGVHGVPDSLRRCLVQVDGRIYCLPGEGVPAAERTIDELAEQLRSAFAEYFHEPVIELQLVATTSRRATVLGQMRSPGAIPLQGGERVLDLIALARGLARSESALQSEELADASGAIYVRGGDVLPVDIQALLEGDMRHNILVHPDDYLYVPSSFNREIQVIGAVQRPQAVGYRSRLTLARAVAYAGGPTEDAYPDRVLVLRGSWAEPEAALVDLQAILEGRAPDLPLQPRDIIYLPGRTSENPRFLLEQFNATFVSGVASRFASSIYSELRDE